MHKVPCIVLLFLICLFASLASSMEPRSAQERLITNKTAADLNIELIELQGPNYHELNLEINACKISKENFNNLVKLLYVDNKIRSLKISSCTEEGKEEYFNPIHDVRSMSLIGLELNQLNFDSFFIKSIIYFIAKNMDSVERIIINNCKGEFYDLRMIIDALVKKQQKLKFLDIANNNMSLLEISSVLFDLMTNSSAKLMYLNISNNARDAGKALSSQENFAIKSCWVNSFPKFLAPTIQYLNMSNMNISDAVAACVLEMLLNKHFQNLIELNLEGMRQHPRPAKTKALLASIAVAPKNNFPQLKYMFFSDDYLGDNNPFKSLTCDDVKPAIEICSVIKISGTIFDDDKLAAFIIMLEKLSCNKVLFDNCFFAIEKKEDACGLFEGSSVIEFAIEGALKDNEFIQLIETLKKGDQLSNVVLKTS